LSGEASIVIAPAARGYELRAEQWVPERRERVFPFFADPLNLERLTPPFLRFHVRRRSTPDVREGTLLTYTLRLHGLPIVWRTRIDEWRPPERFADTQLFGPYAQWHHTHLFDADGSGTRLTDIVRYRLHLGVLLNNRLMSWVHRDVRRIFEYRQAAIAERFAGGGAGADE
jgi:hypothetical protein